LTLSVARLHILSRKFYPMVILTDNVQACKNAVLFTASVHSIECVLSAEGDDPVTHPAVTRFQYMMLLHPDAFATAPWDVDPFEVMRDENKSFAYWAKGPCPGTGILTALEDYNQTLTQSYRNYGDIIAARTDRFSNQTSYPKYVQFMKEHEGGGGGSLNATDILSGYVSLTMNVSDIEFMYYLSLSYQGREEPQTF
jgi:hypothetical protein